MDKMNPKTGGQARPPRVSVGLPVYNGQRYLKYAIESILSQTYRDFELVICDNASTDHTAEICQYYASIDSRVRYFRNRKNLGASPNFNKVFSLSRGEFFKWAAYDDVMRPDFLGACVEALDHNPQAVLAHTKTVVIDQHGDEIPFGSDPQATVYWQGELLRREDLYDPQRTLTQPDSLQRLSTMLLNTTWCFEQFGLIRRTAMLKSSLMPSYDGGDRVFLASTVIQGTFIEIGRPLFARRYHSEQFISKDPSQSAWWLDTHSAESRIQLPGQVSVIIGLLQVVNRAGLSLFQRVRGYWIVLRWVGWLIRLVWRVRHERGILYRMKWLGYRMFCGRVPHEDTQPRSLATALHPRAKQNRSKDHEEPVEMGRIRYNGDIRNLADGGKIIGNPGAGAGHGGAAGVSVLRDATGTYLC